MINFCGAYSCARTLIEMFPIELSHPDAVFPTRGTPGSVGLDLSSCEDIIIPAHSRAVVSTGLRMAVPPGTYGRCAPRSGLSVKFSVDVGAGVIDPDYTGIVGVVLINNSNDSLIVTKGMKIAQLILEKAEFCDPYAVDKLVSISGPTARGDNGFGSTGI